MTLRTKTNGVCAKLLIGAAVVAGLSGVASAQRGGGAGGGGGGGGGRGGQAAPLRTTPVNASYDARTNTVVITGPTDTMEDILKVINEVDSNPTPDNQVYVYKLRNGSAYNIEAVANLLFTGTGGNNRGQQTGAQLNSTRTGTTALGGARAGGGGGARGGAAGGGFAGGGAAGGARAGGAATFGGVGGAAAGTASSAAGLVGQVTIVADPNTNSLLVTTNPKNWQQVKAILDQLDRSVPQVLIKVLIAEVSHDNSTDLGADLSVMNLRLGTDVSSGTATTVSRGQSAGSVFGQPSTGGQIVISEGNFSATIHALQTVGKIDVLSRPYILASDNQLATITVGQTVPYVSNSQVTAQGNTINTVAYSNVGILLDVIPHINPDGMVIMDIAPEISALTSSSIAVTTGVTAPVFSTRSAQSRVAIENGQTAVIGGLMQDQVQSTVNKIPLLGDIPFVGALFQRKQDTKTKTELLIFLTPHVAMRPDQLQTMGADELGSTKLVPNAVAPGTFQEHQKGMDTGEVPLPATQPSGGFETGTVLDPQTGQPIPPDRGGRGGGRRGGQ